MVWSTKYLGRHRDYVVIRHQLRDTEGMIGGVKFRQGYCVVEKNSRYYKTIKQLPYLKNSSEMPLHVLKTLPFIFRDKDVEMVFGRDVYIHYMQAMKAFNEAKQQLEEVKAVEAHVHDNLHCKYVRENGGLCKNPLIEASPSLYCSSHLLLDPKLPEVIGETIPKYLDSKEKKAWKEKVMKKLTSKKSK